MMYKIQYSLKNFFFHLSPRTQIQQRKSTISSKRQKLRLTTSANKTAHLASWFTYI